MLRRLVGALRQLIAPFDVEAFATKIFAECGLPKQESKIEAKIVSYTFRFVSADLKTMFGDKIIAAAIIYDRTKNNSRWNVRVEKVAFLAGISPEILQQAINRGQKLTI